MSSSWWADKLAPAQPQVQAPQRVGITVPAQHVYQQPQQPVYQQQQAPVQQQQVPDDPNRKLSLREAVSRFSGGESAKVEGHLSCPSCGSKTGYTEFRGMAGANAGVMGNRPAPHCMECGYNGRFAQGEAGGNWAS